MQNGIVKIPISVDDFELYRHKIEYPTWEERVIDMIKQNDFVALGLHDCYAHYWLSSYRAFLEKIRKLGRVKTFDEVANEIILGSAK